MLLEESYISFINLDIRKDRLKHMNTELQRVGINAIRQRAIPWKEADYKSHKYATMFNRTPGAIGCHLSQVEVMKKALEVSAHAFVMEDDLVFCSDFHERIAYIENWLNGKQWDVLWLGGTFHSPAYWHKAGGSQDRRNNVSCGSGKDYEHTDDPRIKRTYGCFSTHAYIVNKESIAKIIALLDKHVHESIGIDWLFIKLQPQLKCYAFVPGSVKQFDNMSDIGNGITYYSGFSKLNNTEANSLYWFQDRMNQFNPDTFEWR